MKLHKYCVYHYSRKKEEGMYQKSYSLTVYQDEDGLFSCNIDVSGFKGMDDSVLGAMAFINQVPKAIAAAIKGIKEEPKDA